MAFGKALAVAGLATAALFAGSVARGDDVYVDLDQGWTPQQVTQWYLEDQGSRLIPRAWFMALEQPEGGGRFLDPAYMAGFGYLIGPDGLPVGFVEDRQDDTNLGMTKLRWLPNQANDEPWIGMTCAACHTAEIRAGGKLLRVQGGPTLADFQQFYEAFTTALSRTRSDPARLARFEAKVLPPGASSDDRARLDQALSALIAYQTQLAGMNHTELRYGPGRLDAVGYILNKVAYVAKPDAPSVSEPDAPVSYPFLWNIGQQSRIQWDGIASNGPIVSKEGRPIDIGALGRNSGEVIGVFADVQPPDRSHLFFRSSVQFGNLVDIERQLGSLKPPRWPRDLFPVDSGLAAEGRALFIARCAGCHAELPRADTSTAARPDGTSLERMSVYFPQEAPTFLWFKKWDPTVNKAPADTDRWMACNTVLDQADTGRFEGLPTLDGLERYGARSSTSLMLAGMVRGLILTQAPAAILNGFTSIHGSKPSLAPLNFSFVAPGGAAVKGYADRKAACDAYAGQAAHFREVGYKARPLTGVWASAPFLHNGSVPTLYDLLLPPDQRPAHFFTGSRDFDPQKVGYKTAAGPENTFRFDAVDASGKVVEGNSNRGHDYGNATLSDHQRWAIVEYLKVIGE